MSALTAPRMEKQELRFKRRYLQQENKRFPVTLVRIPEDEWPATDPRPMAVYRSRYFLVQVFAEAAGVMRLSICRTELDADGEWKDGIGWEELQAIKNELGFAEYDALELYPRNRDVVNVANIRHLWVMPELVKFAWRKQS